ncbi:MAG: hypothetical protein AB7S81_02875 [Bdellovibrionales bacterium]
MLDRNTALPLSEAQDQSLVSFEIEETPSGRYAAIITQRRDENGQLNVPISTFEAVYKAIGLFFDYEAFSVDLLRRFSKVFFMDITGKDYKATFALQGQGKDRNTPEQRAFNLTSDNICIPQEVCWPRQNMPSSIIPPSLHIQAFQTTIQTAQPQQPQNQKELTELAARLTSQWNI